jgi:hypothetical protein
MYNEYWSWILSCVGGFGIYLAGKKDWRGWAVGILSETLWLAYAIITKQYGFVFGSVLYSTILINNLYGWLQEYRVKRIRRYLNKKKKRNK